MRKGVVIVIALLLSVTFSAAQKLPKKVGKARQSVASIITFKDGVVLGNGTAMFVGDKGDVLVSYSLLCGADSAVVVDTKGKTRTVIGIVGLDNLYDCAKVRVAYDKKIAYFPVSRSNTVEGDQLYIISYGKKNSGAVEAAKIMKVDSLYSHAYYTFDIPMQDRFVSLPVVNVEGELVAVVQPAATGDSCCYAVGATVTDKLVTTSVTYGKGIHYNMGIRTLLPGDKENALSCMYMQTMIGDSISYRNAINDYIALFPESHEGYMCDAEHKAVYCSDMAMAEKSWEKALSLAVKPSEVYFGKAKVLNTLMLAGDSLINVDIILEQLDKAIAIDNDPMYVAYKADLLLAAGRHADAYECYIRVSFTDLRSADIFARASQCKGALKEYDKAVELMDSAINLIGENEQVAASPYILTRALLKYSAGRYREAVFDYYKYEEIMGSVFNANFYYLRSQAEVKAKMYQQALNDLEKAISIEPSNDALYIEKGILCYGLGIFDDGIEVLESALEIVPDSPDAHFLLGLIYTKTDKIDLAKEHMQKAIESGHPEAAAKLDELKSK